MTLDALRCFVAVADAGGFRRAAILLNRTQPAVSQQVKSLEAEMGGKLLDRKSGQLTPRGQLLYAEAMPILQRADGLLVQMGDFDDEAQRELRIGASDTTTAYTLRRVVRQFVTDRPNARLVLLNRHSATIETEVLEGALDIGLVTSHSPQPNLAYEKLFEQRLVVVVPRHHPLATYSQIRLSRLAGERLLLLDASTRSGRIIRGIFEEAGINPRALLDSGSFEVIKAYIKDGMGVSILPEIMLEKSDNTLVAIRVPGLPRLPVGLIRKEGAYLGNNLEHFIRLLRKAKSG